MEAKELRIGNVVEIIHIDYGRKSTIIDIDDLVTIDEGSDDYSYHPIPITEEWLIKFGFIIKEKDNYTTKYMYKNEIIVKFPKCFSYNFDTAWVDVEYVHQLQNLYFALTGEELELK